MKKALVILLFISTTTLFAQESKSEFLRKAIALMDNGEIEQSIQLLDKGLKEYKNDLDLIYEKGYAYYLGKDYQKSIDLLEPWLKKKKSSFQFFQMVGNAYDILEQPEKAIEVYETGIKKFPNSGPLYLERGIIEYTAERYNEAVTFWEKGASVDPTFKSNYYWLSKLYRFSEERIWSLLYGEIFMNLEFNTARTKEIGKTLAVVLSEALETKNDTSFSLNLTKKGFTIFVDKKGFDVSKPLLPFEGNYSMSSAIGAIALQDTINLQSILVWRINLLNHWFEQQIQYENTLLNYQREIQKLNYFEAYTHWLYKDAFPSEFEAYKAQNGDLYKEFMEWFNNNDLPLNTETKFHRYHY